jgi:hypothetical protein
VSHLFLIPEISDSSEISLPKNLILSTTQEPFNPLKCFFKYWDWR